MSGHETRAPGCDCKVGRVTERYGLGDVDETLVRRWTAGDDRASLRELAREFNRRVVRAALRAATVGTVDGRVDNTYRLLTDDDVSSGMRAQARSRLAREGVDPEELESSFVSHQTVHAHLTDCLGVEPPDERAELADERAKLEALQGRVTAVTTDSLSRLADAEELALGPFDVLVDVSVYCEACDTVEDLRTLLDRGGCDCRDPAEGD